MLGLVALAGWYGAVTPQRSKVDSLDAKIADEKAQLKVVQLLARSQKADKEKTSGTGLLVKAMPSSLQMPSVLRQVQRLASTSSVTLESLTPSTATPAAGYDAVPIDLSVSGPYASVQKFLHGLRVQAGTKDGRIHADGRLFDVQTVGLTPGGDAAERAHGVDPARSVRLHGRGAAGHRHDHDHRHRGGVLMNAIAKSFPGGAAGSNERRQLILLGALGLVLVLLLVWQVPKLLGGSGSSSEAAPAASSAVASAAAPTTAATAPVAAAATGPAAKRAARWIKRQPARDPFVPLTAPAVSATPAPPTPWLPPRPRSFPLRR